LLLPPFFFSAWTRFLSLFPPPLRLFFFASPASANPMAASNAIPAALKKRKASRLPPAMAGNG
jgi:hypothetical protein